jgi:thiosulfate/3-mercaptopyruvate sulfurtransferase
MLPRPEKFASHVRKMGIGDGKKVIATTVGLFSAARVWWMFRSSVTMCGRARWRIAKWKAEGHLSVRNRHQGPGATSVRYQAMMVRDKSDARRREERQSWSRRPFAGRFRAGRSPAGVRGDHMPPVFTAPTSSSPTAL